MVATALEWEPYKRLCDEPQFFTRWALNRTRELVDAPIAAAVASVLDGVPLTKPEDHFGGKETDMFAVKLDRDTVCRVIESLSCTELLPGADESKRRRCRILKSSWLEHLEKNEWRNS